MLVYYFEYYFMYFFITVHFFYQEHLLDGSRCVPVRYVLKAKDNLDLLPFMRELSIRMISQLDLTLVLQPMDTDFCFLNLGTTTNSRLTPVL